MNIDNKGRFLKGMKPHNYGKSMSKEEKDNMENKVYSKRRGKNYNIIYGEKKAEEVLKHQKESFTKERREIISIQHKGKHLSEETKKKIIKANTGKKRTDKTKDKIRKKLVGHEVSLITRERISKKNTGRKESEEVRKEKSKRIKEEYALGIRKPAMLGKVLSNEERMRISERMTLEKHPNWKGGLSYEPYSKDFNNKFKNLIKNRDAMMCIKCNMIEEDHKKLWGLGLAIHHINYDKKLSIEENCCCLCNRCNTEVNNNREHWIKFFQSLLHERYNYEYSSDGEILIKMEIIK